jgi:uncharacterized protein (TIGR00255 family)
MIQSMTGYAARATESPKGRLGLELRSVNSRFLDLQFRVAEELRALEPLLRELLAARLTRGKVDCRLFLNDAAGLSRPIRLNAESMAQLRALSEDARKSFPEAGALRLADILRWPGVIAEPMADDDEMRALVRKLCEETLADLVAARAREGAKLAAIIAERIADMRRRVEKVAPLVPQAVAAYQAKISQRLQEAMGSLMLPGAEERIRAEVALFAAKADVDEEIERLGAHFSEVERSLKEGGARGAPVGKRLDFLAQELNREANTLASKAAGAEISDCALELKLSIEQMREQVQNIE